MKNKNNPTDVYGLEMEASVPNPLRNSVEDLLEKKMGPTARQKALPFKILAGVGLAASFAALMVAMLIFTDHIITGLSTTHALILAIGLVLGACLVGTLSTLYSVGTFKKNNDQVRKHTPKENLKSETLIFTPLDPSRVENSDKPYSHQYDDNHSSGPGTESGVV